MIRQGEKETRETADIAPGDVWTLDSAQAIQSKVASINSAKPAAVFRQGNISKGTRNGDIGGGRFDNVTEMMAAMGVQNVIYDPFNPDIAHNQEGISLIQGGQCQIVTVANVLNIYGNPTCAQVQQAVDALTPDGTAYFGIYEGDGSGIGKVTQYVKRVPTVWQENRPRKTT